MRNHFLSIILSLLALSIYGQTIIPGGEVYGTWHASQSPFHVQGNITVIYDRVLYIEPGVEVFFDDLYKLTVNGRLDATGTETDSILFTATDPTVGWQGIEFYQTNAGLGVSNLQYCILTHGKKNSGSGGAIYVYQSDNVLINHCRIENNYAYEGGGIFIDDGWIDVKNCMIRYNSARYYAGGITCLSSVPYFYNLQVTHNSSGEAGGIAFAWNPNYSYPFFEDLIVTNNVGGTVGGILLVGSLTLVLDNCKICYNRGSVCGGVGLSDSELGYWGWPALSNQVYMNRGSFVHDLYYEGEGSTSIWLDTFTVVTPDSYHAYPLSKITFFQGVQHAIIEQSDTDLYISDSGSDLNDGLTPQSPLRSFDYALRKIRSNADETNTLWVLPGHYSLSESDSAFPVIIKDNVIIKGVQPGEAILDGDSICRVFYGLLRHSFTLSGLTIKNGYVDNVLGAQWMDQVSGGGMYLNSSDGIIDSCSFISNSTPNFGGGVYLDGTYDMHFTNCDFIQNSATKIGGGMHAHNHLGNTDAPLELYNCLFKENYSGGVGGGLSSSSDQIDLVKCSFIANTSVSSGGGMYFNEEVPDIVNCTFIGNISGEEGGGCYMIGDNIVNITNCVFSDNQALSGSALYQYWIAKLYSVNNIFWNTNVPYDDLIHVFASNTKDYIRFYTNYSDIQGGENSIVLQGYYAKRYWQEGNIIQYPEFLDPENGDYSLNWNSPCIEAGRPDTTGLHLPETDLNGNPRIVNDRIDMGAFEFQYPLAVSQPITARQENGIIISHSESHIKVITSSSLQDKTLAIRLISSDGKTIFSTTKPEGETQTSITTNEIPAGIYLVTVSDHDKLLKSEKIVVSQSLR